MLLYLPTQNEQNLPRENEPKMKSLRLFECLLFTFQPSHPLPRIRHFGEAGVGVLLEGEEFFMMVYGFGFPACLQ